MRHRIPTQATPLTPAQITHLRRRNIQLLSVSAALYALSMALTITHGPRLLILPIALVAYTPIVLRARRLRTELGLRPKQPLLPEYPHNILHLGAMMSSSMLAGGYIYVLTTQNHSVSTLLMFPFIAVFMTILAAANCSFVLSPPSCPGCRYPLEGLNFPHPCPECGRRIENASEAVTCRKLNQNRFRTAAILTLIVPFALIIFLSIQPGVVTTRLPRAARLALAPTDAAAFGSVVNTLSPDERDRLIARILDARTPDNLWDMHDQLDWLAAEHARSRLNADQMERFTAQPLDIEIVADPIRRVGMPIRFHLQGNPPIHISGSTSRYHHRQVYFVYFTQGFQIEDRWFSDDPTRLYPTAALQKSDRFSSNDRLTPSAVHTPDQPGPLTVRAGIIAITTTDPNPTITWHDDGSYTITPPPLTTHERTAETTLTITPPG